VNIGLEGMMLMGAFWGIYGADKGGTWVVGLLVGAAAGGLIALVYAFFAIQLRSDQIVGGTGVNLLSVGITGYFFVQLYHNAPVPNGVSLLPDVNLPGMGNFLDGAIGNLSILTWAGFALVIVTYLVLFKTPIGLRIRACGEHPRAADTVGINVYAIRTAAALRLPATGRSHPKGLNGHSPSTCRRSGHVAADLRNGGRRGSAPPHPFRAPFCGCRSTSASGTLFRCSSIDRSPAR
jgi:ABC-type uncharacterized transport system permease subunit